MAHKMLSDHHETSFKWAVIFPFSSLASHDNRDNNETEASVKLRIVASKSVHRSQTF